MYRPSLPGVTVLAVIVFPSEGLGPPTCTLIMVAPPAKISKPLVVGFEKVLVLKTIVLLALSILSNRKLDAPLAVEKVEPVTFNAVRKVEPVFLINTFLPPDVETIVPEIEHVPDKFIATIPASSITPVVPQLVKELLVTVRFEHAFRFNPTWVVVPETTTLLSVKPATDMALMAALAAVLLEPVNVPSAVLALVKFIFFRVMFVALFKLIPFADILDMVPPDPAVVPEPLIVKDPVVF